jgi:hypothetical protein
MSPTYLNTWVLLVEMSCACYLEDAVAAEAAAVTAVQATEAYEHKVAAATAVGRA